MVLIRQIQEDRNAEIARLMRKHAEEKEEMRKDMERSKEDMRLRLERQRRVCPSGRVHCAGAMVRRQKGRSARSRCREAMSIGAGQPVF